MQSLQVQLAPSLCAEMTTRTVSAGASACPDMESCWTHHVCGPRAVTPAPCSLCQAGVRLWLCPAADTCTKALNTISLLLLDSSLVNSATRVHAGLTQRVLPWGLCVPQH